MIRIFAGLGRRKEARRVNKVSAGTEVTAESEKELCVGLISARRKGW